MERQTELLFKQNRLLKAYRMAGGGALIPLICYNEFIEIQAFYAHF